MYPYIYVPAYIPLSDGTYQMYWALVQNNDYNKQINSRPMKRYVFRIPLRPDSWNMYSISQNATSKYEAIQYIISSFNEINSHNHNMNYNYFNTINSLGPDTTTFESIVQHYDFIMEELNKCKPEVYNIHSTEWHSSLA